MCGYISAKGQTMIPLLSSESRMKMQPPLVNTELCLCLCSLALVLCFWARARFCSCFRSDTPTLAFPSSLFMVFLDDGDGIPNRRPGV
jgi:hypothetical protein